MSKNVKIFDLSKLEEKFVYRIERGDTVSILAKRFHASPNAIIAINGLTKEPELGETLLIERADGDFYTVVPTDTLESVCGYDKNKINALKVKNRTDFIYVGMKIVI